MALALGTAVPTGRISKVTSPRVRYFVLIGSWEWLTWASVFLAWQLLVSRQFQAYYPHLAAGRLAFPRFASRAVVASASRLVHPSRESSNVAPGRHPSVLVFLAVVSFVIAPATALAQDTPAKKSYSYTRKSAEIEMRDGVKLHTVIVAPTNAGDEKLPFVIERTPYSADSGANGVRRFREMSDEGYIFVFQDIRGRYKSEGRSS